MEAKFFKEFKYKYRHRKYKSVTIVLGDESCDLDSAVSAIGYAALMEYESRFQRNRFPGYRDPNPEIPRDIFIPMLDVRRDDIHIKTEFLHLWAKYTFDVADLLLKDDLPSLKKQVQRDPTTKIVLVNHHILSDDYKYLAPYVTTIVDHRPMQPNAKSLYGRNVKWIMKDTASCASIVIDEIKYFDDRVDNYPLFFRWYPALLNILRATVVYDTLNFSPALNRFTALDCKMAEYLEEYIETENPQDHPSTWSRATKLKGMLEARADVSRCIAFDVLRKDAKRVESVYFAHVPILLKDYMKKVDYLDAMPEVLETYGCRTLAMLCSYYPPVKIYEGVRKEFAVFSPDREFVEEIIEFLHTWTRPNFILTPKMDGQIENLHAFDVHNMAATREHFVVALNSFFDSKREIALEIKRNREKIAAMKKNAKVEHNRTAKLNETTKRNGSEKKQETNETTTTISGTKIAAKKPKMTVMDIEPVQRFGPIVAVEFDWKKQKPFGGKIVVELAEAMKKGLILPNLMEEQKIKEKQKTVAETGMTEVVMAADESHALEKCMTVEVKEHKKKEEKETVGKEMDKLKTATKQLTVEESKSVKKQESKMEKDPKMTKVLQTIVEPQMVEVSQLMEKQIIGEEQKAVEVQKTETELQVVEESTTVKKQEQKIGEEEMVELSKTVVEPLTAILNVQKILGEQVTASDIKMAKVLMSLAAYKSDVLEESTTVEIQEHNIEEEQKTAEKAIEKLNTATKPQTMEESEATKEQEPKIELIQKMTEVLKTVVESQMVEVSELAEKQIIGEGPMTMKVQKTVTEPLVVEESTTVEQEQKIGEEKESAKVSIKEDPKTREENEMVGVSKTVIESHIVPQLKAEIEQNKGEKQEVVEVVKTVIESQMVEELNTARNQEHEIGQQKTLAEPQSLVRKCGQIIDQRRDGEKQGPFGGETVVESAEAVKTESDIKVLDTLNFQKILGKQVTSADLKMVKLLMMLSAGKSHVLEESTTVKVHKNNKEEEQETAEQAIEKPKTAAEPPTVEESKAVKEQEPKMENAQKMMNVLNTVVEPQIVEVSELVEKQIIGEGPMTVKVQKTVTKPLVVEESTTIIEEDPKTREENEIVGVSKTVVEPHIVPELKAEIERKIGKEQEVVEVVKTLIESQMVEESNTVRNQEQKIGQQQETLAEPQSLVRKCGQIIDNEREGEKQGSFGGETVVETAEAVKRELLDSLNFQKILGKQVTSTDIKMVKVLMMLAADKSHVLEESKTLKIQDHKIEDKQETAENAMEILKTATEVQRVEESQEQEKNKIVVQKQGVADNIEIVKVLESVAESLILEEQKMEEKQKRVEKQKIVEERTKEDIEMEEILKLVSELDISGEKDESERILPKERIMAVAKEADSVFTRCSRMDKKVAAMRREVEREKKLAQQKEMEIEREMTMALKEEEADREKEKVREAEIARQKEMKIEKEIAMALKEEEEELEKRKAREKELEEQEKASRTARLTEHDNSQDSKGDLDEFGSSGF